MTNSDLLYHYFSNTLTPDLEAEFNLRLERDPEFKVQLAYEENLKAAITATHNDTLKAKLNAFEAERTPQKKVLKPLFYGKVAAAILILVSTSWLGYTTFFNTVNYDKLYATHFKIYPNTAYPITRGDSLNSIARRAFLAYESKAYTDALQDLEQLDAAYVNFYKAQTFLGLEQPQKALPLLETECNNNGRYAAQAHWYLALIYLHQKDPITAKRHLKALISKYDYKKDEAQQLLEVL